MRFFHNHICTSSSIKEIEVLDSDKKILSKDENEKLYNVLKRYKSCNQKIQALQISAGHYASGHKYVEVCLPYSSVYKQKATSDFASFPCSCNDRFDIEEKVFCSFVIEV
mgnify:FL=1